jgi:uncharacterized protein (DUF433 family)
MEEVKELGKYIVAHPDICHGKPTFRGTRIMVWQVLEMVAKEKDWDETIRLWSGKVCREAIAEAIHVASVALTPEQYAPFPEFEDESEPDLAYRGVIEKEAIAA